MASAASSRWSSGARKAAYPHGAADIVGKNIMLQFQPYHVVGVAPRDFLAPSQHLTSDDAWAPMNAATLLGGREGMTQRGKGIMDITLRLRHGVSLRVSHPDLTPVLKGETPGARSRSWFRGGLIIAQIACAQFLLVVTGLLVGSYLQVQHIRPGFDMSRHLLFATLLPATEHPNSNFYEDMLGRLSALPGVRRVTSVGSLPLSGSGGGAPAGLHSGHYGRAGSSFGEDESLRDWPSPEFSSTGQ